MADLTLRLEDLALRRELGALLRACADLSPILDEIGSTVVTQTQKRFEDQGGPDGKPWAPLSAASLLIRARGGIGGKRKTHTKDGALNARSLRVIDAAKILIDAGHLRKSITHRASRARVLIGSSREYAALHQFGGKAGRGKKVDIPARPYLGLNSDDRRQIVKILRQRLEVS